MKNYKKVLQTAKKFLGKNELRPALKYAYIDKGRLIATDAHILYICENFGEVTKDATIKEGLYTIENNDLKISLSAEKYPNIDAVIPSMDDYVKLECDTNLCSRILFELARLNILIDIDLFRTFLTSKICDWDIYVKADESRKTKAIVFKRQTGEYKEFALLMPLYH